MKMLPAIALGKSITLLCQRLKFGGGSAAPGLIALKIEPDLIKKLSSQIPQTVIITGTNGKTTTSRMLTQLLGSQGLKVLKNQTGSNLERGVASALIQACRLHIGGVNINIKLSYDLAIWELDEAAFNKLAPILKPDLIIFLNVLRDQLDRYGEVNSVVKKWCQTLKTLSSKSKILINGDDQNLLQLKGCFKGKALTFGLQSHKMKGESNEPTSKPAKLDFEAKNIKTSLIQTNFSLLTSYFSLPVPGFYHVYDATAAICGASLLFPDTAIQRYSDILKSYSPAFGRFERFVQQPSRLKHNNEVYIFLIKNPAGATEVFKTIASHLHSSDSLLIALNDNFADGKDVSWIWDANFEILRNSSRAKLRDLQIIASGTRAQDLAVRLKYAGLDPKHMVVEDEIKKAFKQATEGLKGRLFTLPTYTALLQLQKILARAGIKSHYWKETN